MKAYDRKKRLTVSQRDILKKCVVEEFTKYKALMSNLDLAKSAGQKSSMLVWKK